jgi:hypothetical protein
MHVPINVKSPNNISKWQMAFNSAFKGLIFLLWAVGWRAQWRERCDDSPADGGRGGIIGWSPWRQMGYASHCVVWGWRRTTTRWLWTATFWTVAAVWFVYGTASHSPIVVCHTSTQVWARICTGEVWFQERALIYDPEACTCFAIWDLSEGASFWCVFSRLIVGRGVVRGIWRQSALGSEHYA